MDFIPEKPHRVRLGAKIRQRRKAAKLSLREFGLMTGIDYAYLSNIENGKANATVDVLAKIADGLGVTIKDLF